MIKCERCGKECDNHYWGIGSYVNHIICPFTNKGYRGTVCHECYEEYQSKEEKLPPTIVNDDLDWDNYNLHLKFRDDFIRGLN